MLNWIGKGFAACESIIHGRALLRRICTEFGIPWQLQWELDWPWWVLWECEMIVYDVHVVLQIYMPVRIWYGQRERARDSGGGGFYCGWLPQALILCAIVMAIMDLLANGLWGLYSSAVSWKETSLEKKKDLLCQPFSIFGVVYAVCNRVCSFRANIIKLGRQECIIKNLSVCSLRIWISVLRWISGCLNMALIRNWSLVARQSSSDYVFSVRIGSVSVGFQSWDVYLCGPDRLCCEGWEPLTTGVCKF